MSHLGTKVSMSQIAKQEDTENFYEPHQHQGARLFPTRQSPKAWLRCLRGFLLCSLSLAVLCFLVGCGVTSGIAVSTAKSPATATDLSISPGTITLAVDGSITVSLASSVDTLNQPSPSACAWDSNNRDVVRPNGAGTFIGISAGSATISASCGGDTATATALVTPPGNPRAIKITQGGIYSGIWQSNDTNTPAVSIETADPVTITDSTVSGKGGALILSLVNGGNLTVTNTTGTGEDPMVYGLARPKFVEVSYSSVLTVKNCTMSGVSLGIYVAGSTLSSLSIVDNKAFDLDDRVSDGQGGAVPDQRVLGHFVILNQDSAPQGGEIAWNQLINSPANSSIEDLIDIADSHGSDASHEIVIHDNYLEGAFAPVISHWYTGGGIQMDGASDDPARATGFIRVYENVIVRTANYGISIGAGHDISMINNRVVSCGQDGNGNWINFTGPAYSMWNYNNTDLYHNNVILGTTGGVIALIGGRPTNADANTISASQALSNVVSGNDLEHPCWQNGVVTQTAEENERAAWSLKIAKAGVTIGDTHVN